MSLLCIYNSLLKTSKPLKISVKPCPGKYYCADVKLNSNLKFLIQIFITKIKAVFNPTHTHKIKCIQ